MSRRFGLGALAALFLLSFAAVAADDAAVETYRIPYRLTDTKHVLVRAKINGQGPFNFILDTGAPALFVATSVAKKVGVAADADGWGNFAGFELEGGLVLDKIQGQVADPFQLEGMNQMGLAGAELHGVLGYNLLARYKMEIDFTRRHMTWTRLKGFEPEVPARFGKAPANLNAMGGMVKMVATLIGKPGQQETRLGGYLGIELLEKDGTLIIDQVHADSPAAQAGLRRGDQLRQLQGQAVKSSSDVEKLAAKLSAGDTALLRVSRGGEEMPIQAKLTGGF